ncbi:MAG: ABC transporter substrate-binding protein [Pseudomonadota bacterium]
MKRFLFAAATAALLAVSPAAADTTQGVSDTEVVIGGHHDLSGIFAAFSVPAVTAANLYFDEVNANGGVHGRKIRYITEDHGYQAPKAVQAVNKLINRDKVFAMLLSLGTPMNLAAFRQQDPKGIPNISPLSGARQMLQEPLDLHYAGTSSYYDQLYRAVPYMKDNHGSTVACAMYIPSDFGKEIQAGAKESAEANGLTWGTESTHKPDENEFVGALGKMKEAGCNLVATALGVRQTITLLGTAKKIGLTDMNFIGSSASFHTAIAKVPGGITEGYFAAAGWQDLEARVGDPEVGAWVKKYIEATGEKFPGTGALLGRSAAELFVRGLEAAGPDLTHASFQKGMESLEFDDKIAGNKAKLGPGDHLVADVVFISKIGGGSWKTLTELK